MAHAVVIPGGSFGPAAGLLLYAGAVAERRGASVHWHWWSQPPPSKDVGIWVAAEVAPLLGAGPLLIGKSLGTNAAGLAADHHLPAVWLTPLLTDDWVVDGLSRATAPCLLIGGTSDPLWDSAQARRLSRHVVEIPAANHGLQVPGPVSDSIAVLARVVTAIDDFLAEISWPRPDPAVPHDLSSE
jgi:pimeloyl-ACP methyl ester carboxylesterase